MPSPFTFRRYGKSGIEVSELFPHDRRIASTTSASSARCTPTCPNHEPSLMLMNCGDGRLIAAELGSWVTYGLGSENQNLPGFIAMCPGGYPIVGLAELAARLPARRLPGHLHRHASTPTSRADREHPQQRPHPAPSSAGSSTCCGSSTSGTCEQREADAQLEARIQSFELAFRMQTEAPDAFDISTGAGRHPRAATATGTHGRAAADRPAAARARRPLRPGLARRRPAVGQPRRHRGSAQQAGRPGGTGRSPRFLNDLKAAACSTSTLVIWGGEFGRTPVAETVRGSCRTAATTTTTASRCGWPAAASRAA